MEKTLKDLFIDELHDILSAEEQIVEALPAMVKASESADLKEAFASHLQETKEQVRRLEKIFKLLKIARKEKFCKGTKGLIDECKDILKEFKSKSPVRDAALISKAQRIEHYEISAYGTLRTFADDMDLDSSIADLLQETLNEEGNADHALTKLAQGGLLTSGINQEACASSTNSYTDKAKTSKNLTYKSSPVKRKSVVAKQKPKSITVKKKTTRLAAKKKAKTGAAKQMYR